MAAIKLSDNFLNKNYSLGASLSNVTVVNHLWNRGNVCFWKGKFVLCIYTAWNIGVRTIFNLPYQSHRWLLGPLLRQPHISVQLHKRSARFLHVMKHCSNNIVIANTPMGHNIAYIRNVYGVDIKE